jgi:inhibitor of cysteine peptidase
MGIAIPFALIACMAVAACGNGDRSAGDPVTLAAADSGRTVSAAVGQEIVLTLATTPGTGYSWMLTDSAAPMLRLVEGTAVTRDSAMEGRVGAPASATWRFRADTAGSGTVRLEYRRPWERDAPAARLYEVNVAVRQ